MKPSAQDRTEGKLHEVKGKIKEEAGKAANDHDLEASGNAEKKPARFKNGSVVPRRLSANRERINIGPQAQEDSCRKL